MNLYQFQIYIQSLQQRVSLVCDIPPQTNPYSFQSAINDKLQSMMSDIIGTRTYFFKQTCSFFVVMNPIEFHRDIISTRNEIFLIVLKNDIKIRKLRINRNISNNSLKKKTELTDYILHQ